MENEIQLTAAEIRIKVDEILTAANVTMSVVNAGVRIVKPEKDKCSCPGDYSPPMRPYEQDAWRITFKKIVGGHSTKTVGEVSFDYFTGVGNRKLPKGYVAGYDRKANYGTLAWEQNEALKKPVKPTAADVLYCLVSDGQAMHQSFYDWASDFGYDTDSLKAFETYNACCKSGRDLRVVFTSEQVRAIEEAVRDL